MAGKLLKHIVSRSVLEQKRVGNEWGNKRKPDCSTDITNDVRIDVMEEHVGCEPAIYWDSKLKVMGLPKREFRKTVSIRANMCIRQKKKKRKHLYVDSMMKTIWNWDIHMIKEKLVMAHKGSYSPSMTFHVPKLVFLPSWYTIMLPHFLWGPMTNVISQKI